MSEAARLVLTERRGKFAQFASNEERFVEAEINPLIVRPQGQGAVAVDAVMRLARHHG